jgi:hypothetical protein
LTILRVWLQMAAAPVGDIAMRLLLQHYDPANDRIHHADAVTGDLVVEIIDNTCRRFPSIGQTEKTARIERFIGAEAWTETALALIDLELPQWQIRRIVYDEGEWHCALSRQRELPEWLDESIEAHTRRFGTGYPQRVCRCSTHGYAVEAKRPPRPTRRGPDWHSDVLRQFRIRARTNRSRSFPGLAQLPNVSRQLTSPQVLVRFLLRTIILVVFAAFASIGFCRSLAALLAMSIIFSTVLGVLKREAPFDIVLNHWDETVAYAALFSLVSAINNSVPL